MRIAACLRSKKKTAKDYTVERCKELILDGMGKPDLPVEIAGAPQIEVEDDDPDYDSLGGRLIVDKHHEDGELVLYEPDEFHGQFSFRDTILEQLDRYWVYSRRMRKNDPEAYQMYRQIGAVVSPYGTLGVTWFDGKLKKEKTRAKDLDTALPSWFLNNRPGFGCVAFGTSPFDGRLWQPGRGIRDYPGYTPPWPSSGRSTEICRGCLSGCLRERNHLRGCPAIVQGPQSRSEKKGSGEIPGSFVQGTVHFMHRQEGCPFLV
jgi:hypothetical protein